MLRLGTFVYHMQHSPYILAKECFWDSNP
uniref:Uncharacterized protein n=1 Tax=Rhizophora mucronata TaxID=61149 RepID=A0A2P2QT13_RHIMU